MYLLAPFILQNFKKILTANVELPTEHLNWIIFLVQTIIITFLYLLALLTVQNLKKFLQQILSYEDVPFLRPKMVHLPQRKTFLESY